MLDLIATRVLEDDPAHNTLPRENANKEYLSLKIDSKMEEKDKKEGKAATGDIEKKK